MQWRTQLHERGRRQRRQNIDATSDEQQSETVYSVSLNGTVTIVLMCVNGSHGARPLDRWRIA